MEPQTIVGLQAENVKRLKAVTITPSKTGAVVIGGKNAQGKSSVLDSIIYALGGKPSDQRPVRDGESGAQVVVETDSLVVTRRFSAGGKSTLKVEAKGPDGARTQIPSPQSLLDSLTAAVGFDPLAFARMDSKRQAKLLEELTGFDGDAWAGKRQAVYDERTAINRDLKHAKSMLDDWPVNPSVGDELLDAGDLLERINAASQRETAIGRQEMQLERVTAAGKEAKERVASLRGQLAKAEALLANLRDEHRDTKDDLEKMRAEHDPDEAARLSQDLRQIQDRNKAIESNRGRKQAEARAAELQAQSDDMTGRLKQIDEERVAAIAAAKLPVDGLSFDADGVQVDGIPFSQRSSAEQIRISTALGLAMNPNLRVLLIRDGSLLDDEHLATIASMAQEAGAQVWIERVGDGAEVSVVIEDGEVLA